MSLLRSPLYAAVTCHADDEVQYERVVARRVSRRQSGEADKIWQALMLALFCHVITDMLEARLLAPRYAPYAVVERAIMICCVTRRRCRVVMFDADVVMRSRRVEAWMFTRRA